MDGKPSPRAPLPRLAALLAAPPAAALAALAALGLLDWRAALAAAAASAAVLGLLARRWLGDADALARFAADPAEPPPPRLSGLFPGLAEAAARIAAGRGRARAGLEARAAAAEEILEGLPHPLILVAADRQVARATMGAEALLGAVERGRDLSSAIRHPEVLAAVDRVLAGGGRELIEFDLRFPTERVVNALAQALPPLPPGGPAALLSLFDVTEIRRVHRMRADFLANAGHELKTPLSVVSGCLETLRGPARDDAEARARFADMMHAHVGRMVRLVDDLLSLSRIEMDENTPPAGTVDLRRLAREAAAELEVPAAARGIEIRVEPGDAPPEIPGDRADIARLLRNLVENAVTHGRGDSVVRVGLRAVRPPAGGPLPEGAACVEISVADDGPGIAAEHVPRLTERFYRVADGRAAGPPGTGLGLAIVKHVVGRHRGALAIESAEGAGSRFAATLPAGRPGAPADPAPENPAALSH